MRRRSGDLELHGVDEWLPIDRFGLLGADRWRDGVGCRFWNFALFGSQLS